MWIMKHICFWYNCFILFEMRKFGVSAYESKVNIDMLSDSNGKVIIVPSNSSVIIYAVNFGPEITSIVFEAHTQKNNVTLSYSEQPALHNSIVGKNVGLTLELKDKISDPHMWLISENSQNTSVFVKLVPYQSKDLVPGGCNMEFPVKIAPYLLLTDDQFRTRLEFQHANIGSPRDTDPPSCSHTISYISYDIFVFYLQEHSYSEDEYFRGINQMTNISFLHNHATKVYNRVQHPETRADFFKYPKTGVVYNIVAKYTVDGTKREAAYVPSVTYGCILAPEDMGCGLPYTDATKPTLLILSVFGLFIAFFGHKCFTIEMFFFGFLMSIFITFILISKYDRQWEEKSTFVFSFTLGILGGIVWALIWLIMFRPIISVLPVGLILGYLLTATLLYSPVGNSEMFINDKIYWMFIAGSTAVITALFLTVPKALSIIGSSVVGSYTAVLLMDVYLGSSLIFITINVIKRALATQSIFLAINHFPFETNDIVVCSLWVAVTVLSLALQTYMNWGKQNFPTPFCTCLKVKYPGCTCSSGIQNYPCNIVQGSAAQPLISENVTHHSYSTMG